jgi:translation initiation factor 3 subunit E
MNAAAAWGKLAAEILSGNWDGAMEELNKVKEIINDRVICHISTLLTPQSFSDPTIQLYHRTWLIHWSLFPFFNTENGRESLCELFFSPAYINSIQTSSPWILRYLTAAVVTSHLRKRNSNNYHKQVRELVKIIKQETYQYSDPITEFIYALYVDFDFDLAQKKLVQVETVLKCDFFLASLADEFVECARHLISEAYCRIHQVIDIKYYRL